MLMNQMKYEAIKKKLEIFNHRLQPFGGGHDPFDTPERQMARDLLGILDQIAEDLYLPKSNNEIDI